MANVGNLQKNKEAEKYRSLALKLMEKFSGES
jgi:hypothetical protein